MQKRRGKKEKKRKKKKRRKKVCPDSGETRSEKDRAIVGSCTANLTVSAAHCSICGGGSEHVSTHVAARPSTPRLCACVLPHTFCTRPSSSSSTHTLTRTHPIDRRRSPSARPHHPLRTPSPGGGGGELRTVGNAWSGNPQKKK